MRIYTERPTQQQARKAWDLAEKIRNKEPIKLWKNPNCWGKPRIADNAWGWWIAEFDNSVYPYEPIHPKMLSA